MGQPSHVTAASVALAALAGRELIAAPVALVAVAVLGRAALVVLVWQVPAALAALAARAALASMRAASPMALLVVMPARVAMVAWVELLARRAPTLRRCLAVLAVSAVAPELLVVARQVPAAWMEHPSHATAASAALAALAERELIAVLVALAAVAVLGRASLVVWAWRAPAALVATAARAGPGSMQVVSPMGPLVVMPDKVAVVAWVELRARRAQTPRP
jgi:hypothetical protein